MKISEDLAELIGALMGDGYIHRANRKYQIGFVGNPITDKEYFEYSNPYKSKRAISYLKN